jgi:hypothetical protein
MEVVDLAVVDLEAVMADTVNMGKNNCLKNAQILLFIKKNNYNCNNYCKSFTLNFCLER